MASTLQPRECTVSKQPQQKFGFFLRVEQDTAGHLIRNVERGSPAHRAGLRDGDRVLRVNGRVDGLDHESVVGKIKQSEERTSLLVVDKETDSMYKLVRKHKPLLGIAQDSTLAKMEERVELHTEQKVNHKPRICKMVKGPNGFGFNPALHSPLQVQSQGAAGRAGVENNDFLVEVNGVNVTKESYDKVVARIQSTGDRLTLLVCSKDAYRYFQGQNIPITASMAESDTPEPPAHTENHPAEPERNSPEPRERVSNPAHGSGLQLNTELYQRGTQNLSSTFAEREKKADTQ
uniref:PDZ domain containing 1 n=1 Tax=Junco hyemalis TaxID=40217 RepID=A0A8C5IM69_JUNHY